MNKFEQIDLPNGLRLLLVPIAGAESATVMSLYGVGSRHETRRTAGGTHFIEHLAFKGTRRRPSTLDLSKELDSMGAEYNAYTDRDNTAFHVRLASDRIPNAIDLLEDMVYHSTFKASEIESEKGVVVEELKMYDDNPMIAVSERMIEVLFSGSTLGWLIGSTPDNVRKLTRKDLVDYRDRYYRPSRTVVAVAGGFEREPVLALLKKKYGSKQEPKLKSREFTPYKPASSRPPGPQVRIMTRESEQVQLCMGFPTYKMGDKRMAPLAVLCNILGGNMSSRLFIEVRERLGLAYAIASGMESFQDMGHMQIQAGLALGSTSKVVDVAAKQMARLKKTLVSNEELERAKGSLEGRLALHFENSGHLAEFYGRQALLFGKVATPEKKLARIKKVTREDVRRVAQEILKPGRMAACVIGPHEEAEAVGLAKALKRL